MASIVVEFPVCPDDNWYKLSFVKNPVNWSNGEPANWSTSDLITYVRSSVAPRAMASLSFLALSCCILLGFLLWRVMRCTCMCCCHRCKGSGSLHGVLRGRLTISTKVIGLIICLGIAGTAIYGLTLSNANTAQEGWDTLEGLRDYVQQLVDALNQVVTQVRVAQQRIWYAYSYVESVQKSGLITNAASTPLPGITAALSNVAATANDILATLVPSINRLQQETVVRVDDASSSWEDQSLYYWDVAVKTSKGAFGAALAFMLLSAAAAMLNWGCGMALVAMLQMLLVLFFFAVAAALSSGLVMLSDGCSNLEAIVVQVAPDQFKQLASFYTNPYSNPADAEYQLAAANLVNVTQIQGLLLDPMTAGLVQTMENILPFVPPAFSPQIRGLMRNLTNATSLILDALGSVDDPPSGALGFASLPRVQSQYSSTKQYLCCTVPDLAMQYWVLLTALGWLALALGVLCMLLLGYLDQIQGTGACCSCSCMLPLSMPPAGKPVEEQAEVVGRQVEALGSLQWPEQQDAFVEVTTGPAVRAAGSSGGATRWWHR